MITREEAIKLCQIAGTADGGCTYCEANLISRFMAAFPEVDWVSASQIANPGQWEDPSPITPYEGDWSQV